jgi:hypothetical protein
VLVLLAGTAGLLAAAASLWWAFLLIAFGALLDGGWITVLTLCQLAAGILGVRGAVRLARGRGWRSLALASLLGLWPTLRIARDGLAFGWAGTDLLYSALALAPPVALVLVLLPPVRRWAGGLGRVGGTGADALTRSGA